MILERESEAVKNFLQNPGPEAFSRVVDEHIGMARSMAMRIVMNEHDADDVVQEAFISAYNGIEGFKGDARFASWLGRIVVNKCYSFLRARKNPARSAGELSFDPTADSHHAPDRMLRSKERIAEIHSAVTELPEHLRAALVLVAIENTSVDEAAYILDCPKATLYWRIHKARKILAEKPGKN